MHFKCPGLGAKLTQETVAQVSSCKLYPHGILRRLVSVQPDTIAVVCFRMTPVALRGDQPLVSSANAAVPERVLRFVGSDAFGTPRAVYLPACWNCYARLLKPVSCLAARRLS